METHSLFSVSAYLFLESSDFWFCSRSVELESFGSTHLVCLSSILVPRVFLFSSLISNLMWLNKCSGWFVHLCLWFLKLVKKSIILILLMLIGYLTRLSSLSISLQWVCWTRQTLFIRWCNLLWFSLRLLLCLKLRWVHINCFMLLSNITLFLLSLRLLPIAFSSISLVNFLPWIFFLLERLCLWHWWISRILDYCWERNDVFEFKIFVWRFILDHDVW